MFTIQEMILFKNLMMKGVKSHIQWTFESCLHELVLGKHPFTLSLLTSVFLENSGSNNLSETICTRLKK